MQAVVPRDPRRQHWAQCTNPDLEPRLGTVFALSNGRLGLRGAHEECPAWGRPEFYIAGTYAGGPPSLLGFHDPDHILTHPDRMRPEVLDSLGPDAITTLPNLPFPLAVRLTVAGVPFAHESAKVLSNERLLQIDEGTVRRRLVFRDAEGRRTCVDSLRFVSFADRSLIVLRYTVKPLNHDGPVEAAGFLQKDVSNPNGVRLWREVRALEEPELNAIVCETAKTGVRVAIAQRSTVRVAGEATVLELFVAAGCMGLEDAVRRAEEAAARGCDVLLAEHLAAWRSERESCHLAFDGDIPTVQGVNFGQMHLQMALAPESDRVGIPIKGLTGHGYRFLSFWDMDFHMFPYYLLTRPRAARRLLAYRYGQLDAYRANARRWGARGAQVPWETAVEGREETAPWLCLQEREIHISADAAYMFKLYDELTPDHDAMATMGAEFVMETARFYASRVRWNESARRYDLPGVGCPDQYHTFADNNVFVSRMAKWNIEFAAEIGRDSGYAAAARKIGLSADELREWARIGRDLYVIGPNQDGIIEEFDGFFALSADMDGICETFCRHAQAVKQPDVVATFAYFEDQYAEEVRRRNWKFYAERTLHGSSLSLPGMAYGASRCGLHDEALYNLQKSARMDLDDVNLDASRGVHLSGYAVQWYAIVLGFGGLTPRRDCLEMRPSLPRQWAWLEYSVHWQFQRLHVRLTQQDVSLRADACNSGEVRARVGGREVLGLAPGQTVQMTVGEW